MWKGCLYFVPKCRKSITVAPLSHALLLAEFSGIESGGDMLVPPKSIASQQSRFPWQRQVAGREHFHCCEGKLESLLRIISWLGKKTHTRIENCMSISKKTRSLPFVVSSPCQMTRTPTNMIRVFRPESPSSILSTSSSFFWAIRTDVVGLFGKSLKGDISHRDRVTVIAHGARGEEMER
jgi:hypothetical protein